MKDLEEMEGVRERLAHAKGRALDLAPDVGAAILLHALVEEAIFILDAAIKDERGTGG